MFVGWLETPILEEETKYGHSFQAKQKHNKLICFYNLALYLNNNYICSMLQRDESR